MAHRSSLARLMFVLWVAALAACGGGGSDDTPAAASQPPPPPPDGNGNPFGNAESLPPSIPTGFLVTAAAVSAAATSLSFSPDGSVLYVASLGGFVFAYPVAGGVLAAPPVPFLSGLSSLLGVLATSQGVFVSVLQGSEGAVLRARDTNGDFMADVTEVVISGLPVGRHNTNGLALGPDGMLYVVNGNANDSGFRDEGGSPDTPPFSGSLLRIDPAATGLTPTPAMVVGTGWRNIYDVAFVPAGHPSLTPGLAAVTMNGPDGMSYSQPGAAPFSGRWVKTA